MCKHIYNIYIVRVYMYVCFGQTKHANEQHIGAFTVPVCQLMDLLSRTFGELWKLLPLNAIRGRFTFLPGLSRCILYCIQSLVQAHCSCSCPTRRGNTRAVSSGAGVTPPPRQVSVCLAPRSVSATTGPTTPCWPKRGAPASWETKSSPSVSSETSLTSAPTKTTGSWVSGRTV